MSNYVARITRVSDGVTVVMDCRTLPNPIIDESSPDYFWWTGGNYGCDCNRSLEFYRARGEPEPGKEDSTRCLGHGAFTVVLVTDDGKTFGPL